MPNRDGTGPQGKGPRTGRGMGNCAPQSAQGAPTPVQNIPRNYGGGYGRGGGMGYGRGRRAATDKRP